MSEPTLPTPPGPSNAPALRHHRDRVIVELCDHFAQDHIEAGELEALIDRAHSATSLAELQSLTADLPALDRPPEGEQEDVMLARPGETRDRQFIAAIMGGNEREGSWAPARTIYSMGMMGGVELDFREARMGPGVTELHCIAIMGGIEIIVPPGVTVESDGIGIMGAFEHAGGKHSPVDTSAPVLRVTGLAVMGAVEISVRRIGESAREARRRLKKERREIEQKRRTRLGDGSKP